MKEHNASKLDVLIALTEIHLGKLKELGEETPEFAQEINSFHERLKLLDNQ